MKLVNNYFLVKEKGTDAGPCLGWKDIALPGAAAQVPCWLGLAMGVKIIESRVAFSNTKGKYRL